MRPVLLEMTGFGSYREPATVDFTDADYFALVGPTGAGKSTVVEAMTFALYGSVPRWDDRRMVALALTPTENRGVVRLVFDVGGHRYVAVRELRRSPIGVGIKNGRLERLIDPNALGSTDDETEVIAADSHVNRAVEELLGLSFEHFCSCVVLPQGDFAEFLHAKPSERQKILTRLLGIGLYETIGQRANTEATQAKQRASLLEEQIGQLATVTPEAKRDADQRVGLLADLGDYVAAVLPELAAATETVNEARRNTTRIREEQALLADLSIPTDLAARAERLADAASAADEAALKLLAAEKADDDARQAFETAAAARGPLEQAGRNHAEHAQLEQQLPDAKGDRAKAAAKLATVTIEREAAIREFAAARDAFEAASATAVAARQRVETVRAEHGMLVRLSVPAEVAEIDEREAASRKALVAASRRVEEAEEAEAGARRDLDAAPARAVLQQAKHDHAELAAVLATELDLGAQLDRSRDEMAATQSALEEGRRAVERAREARDDAARADAAAALRPHLVTGQPCPVCEHPVAELPPPLDQETLAMAGAALITAEDNLRTATNQNAAAVAAEQQTVRTLQAAVASAAKLRQALTGDLADEAAVDAELSRLDSLSTRLHEAVRDLQKARVDHTAALRDVDKLTKKHTAARTALNAARDPLVSLGAPPVDGLNLADAWNLLAGWADGEAAARIELLGHAEAVASEADALSASSGTRLTRAREEVERLDAVTLDATRADQETQTDLHRITVRLSELAEALAGAPDNAAVVAQLARIEQLESNAKIARETLQATREVRNRAAEVLIELQSHERAAWDDLRTARDPLVPLGAPPIQQDDLRSAWTELVEWAAEEVRAREVASAGAEAALGAAEKHCDETEQAIGEELGRSSVALPDDRPIAETAAAAVAAELERARAHARSIRHELERLADLTSRKEAADEHFAVAHMLGGLLRSDGFPQWLVTSALDVLIQDASASLAELSGGQFDLTHEKGDFLVIDHNNADLRRPVKTLSGGETFQASLALALALSAQITTLAAAGTARLDSIFLDEGFGTLDETTLDTVADTLESLARQGDRMVGVITHVSALADRVPVKFKVIRDQFGSTVTRDGPSLYRPSVVDGRH